MIRHLFWMAVSVGARVGGGFLTFVLIARALGPEDFGQYMYWFSATYLLSLVPNFGLGNLLLREIAQDASRLPFLTAIALRARSLISLTFLIAAILGSNAFDSPLLVLLLLCANLLEVLAETFFVGYRANGLFSRETQLATSTVALQLCLVTLVAWISAQTTYFALAYFGSRLFQFATARYYSIKVSGDLPKVTIHDVGTFLFRARDYAIDFGLGNIFGHIDSVVLKFYLGVGAVGVYQAGMRVFQGGVQLAPILANVFLPTAAKASANTHERQRSTEKVQAAFILCGATFGLLLTYGAEFIASVLFGSNYDGLADLFPWLGMLFFVRFFAGAWGLLLTAGGHQRFRALSTVAYLALVLAVAALWVPRFGTVGWLASLVAGNALLAFLYMAGTIQRGAAKLSTSVVLTTTLGFAAFMPQLYLLCGV